MFIKRTPDEKAKLRRSAMFIEIMRHDHTSKLRRSGIIGLLDQAREICRSYGAERFVGPAFYKQVAPNGAGERTHLAPGFGTVLSFLILALSLVFPRSLQGEDKPVSYYQDLVPIFKRSCTGCHHPGKLKGELELTTYEAILKGSKHGAGFKTNDLKETMIIEEIGGAEP